MQITHKSLKKQTFFFILSLLVIALSSACSTAKVQYPDSRVFQVEPKNKKADFVFLWSKSSPMLEPFGSYPLQFSGIARSPNSDSLIIPRYDGEVARLRAANGELVWTKRFPYSFGARPSIFGTTIYLPTLDGHMLALSEGDGRVLWDATVKHSFEGMPAANAHYVVALDAEDVLYCWDATTGKELWRFANERSNNFTLRGSATPIFDGDSVIVGFAGGQVMRFDLATGKKEWSLDISGGESEFADVDFLALAPVQKSGNGTTVSKGNGLVYAAGRSSGVYAIDSKDGSVVWKYPVKGISAFDVDQNGILFGTTSDKLISLNLEGKRRWGFVLKGNIPTSIVSYGPYVVVTTGEGPVYLLDGDTGFPFQKWTALSGVHAPVTFGGERLYLHSDRGEVYAMKVGW